jgi:hypothetical protein
MGKAVGGLSPACSILFLTTLRGTFLAIVFWADSLTESSLTHVGLSHGEAYFPDTAGMVIRWPTWSALREQALRKRTCDNAATFLRLV